MPQPPTPDSPRRPYTPPRLTTHGTAQELTLSASGVDASGVPDGA